MQRRTFLRSSAFASIMAGSTQSLLALAGDNVYRKNIGLQIYTLRDQLKADLKGTLKAVAGSSSFWLIQAKAHQANGKEC